MTNVYCMTCWVWLITDCERNFKSNIRIKHKNGCAGSEKAAELLLSSLLTIMHDLLAFPSPGLIPLLDFSVAMAVHARVTAHPHLSSLPSTPHAEKVHCGLDTNPRGSSDPHTTPNSVTGEFPLTWVTTTKPEFDRCTLYKLHIIVRWWWPKTLSEECRAVTDLQSRSEKQILPSLRPSFLPSFPNFAQWNILHPSSGSFTLPRKFKGSRRNAIPLHFQKDTHENEMQVCISACAYTSATLSKKNPTVVLSFPLLFLAFPMGFKS